jgi:hypothetical protein
MRVKGEEITKKCKEAEKRGVIKKNREQRGIQEKPDRQLGRV